MLALATVYPNLFWDQQLYLFGVAVPEEEGCCLRVLAVRNEAKKAYDPVHQILGDLRITEQQRLALRLQVLRSLVLYWHAGLEELVITA